MQKYTKYLVYAGLSFAMALLTYWVIGLTNCGIGINFNWNVVVNYVFSDAAIIAYLLLTFLYFLAMVGINIVTNHNNDNNNDNDNEY